MAYEGAVAELNGGLLAALPWEAGNTEDETGYTMMTRQDAERRARALVAMLKGDGWKPQVWENMGWHYKAVSGPVKVYPSGAGDRFWCMIGSEPKECPGGAAFWTPQRTRTFKDPNRAVKDAMRHVYVFAARIKETITMAERAMGK